MNRSTKCKNCRKYLGESFRDFPEGTVDDGTSYWCSEKCYQKYQLKIKKKKLNDIRHWTPKSIKGKKMQMIADWINCGGDFSSDNKCLDDKYTIGKDKRPNHITKYGEGYNQAISDVFRKLGLDYKTKRDAKRGNHDE